MKHICVIREFDSMWCTWIRKMIILPTQPFREAIYHVVLIYVYWLSHLFFFAVAISFPHVIKLSFDISVWSEGVCVQLAQKKKDNLKWFYKTDKWTLFSWITERRTEKTSHNSQLVMCEHAGAAPQVFFVSAYHISLLRDLYN